MHVLFGGDFYLLIGLQCQVSESGMNSTHGLGKM